MKIVTQHDSKKMAVRIGFSLRAFEQVPMIAVRATVGIHINHRGLLCD